MILAMEWQWHCLGWQWQRSRSDSPPPHPRFKLGQTRCESHPCLKQSRPAENHRTAWPCNLLSATWCTFPGNNLAPPLRELGPARAQPRGACGHRTVPNLRLYETARKLVLTLMLARALRSSASFGALSAPRSFITAESLRSAAYREGPYRLREMSGWLAAEGS